MKSSRVDLSAQLHASILGSAEVGLIVLNARAEIVAWNTWLERASDIGFEQVVGQRVDTLFPELARSRICSGIDSALRQGLSVILSPYFSRHCFPLRDVTAWKSGAEGTTMQQRISIKPVDADDEDRHCIVQVQDLSDAMRRETQLRDQAISMERLARQHRIAGAEMRAVLEGAFDAILTLDEDGVIQSFNRASTRIFGYDAEEALGERIELLLPSLSPVGEAADVSGSDAEVVVEHVGRRKDESEFIAEVALAAMEENHDGGAQHWVAIVRDISSRKAIEQDLKDFVYVVSHDLQSPLHTVLSFAKRLAKQCEGRLDAKAEKALDYVIDGSERMGELIRDLASYSRVDAQGKELVAIDLGVAMTAALENLHLAIEESGAQVNHVDLPCVMGDPIQLVQLIQNLVGNALKFCGSEAPRIHISAVGREDVWEIGVEDNGIGIGEGFRDRVFQVFQRLHTPSEYPGTGIGLSICKKIVERHGGRIWIESEEGEGTTFRFTLYAAEVEKIEEE